MESEILVGAASMLGAAFGAFLSYYMKKKGEHLATKEDFEELLSQIRKTTHETESIKVELSRGSWVNQQQWILRERYYVGLLENLYALKNSIESLKEWYLEPGSEYLDAEFEKKEGFQNLLRNTHKAFNAIKELHGPAEIVISTKAIEALTEFYSEYWSASEFSMCNSEWLGKAYECVQEAHNVVLREAKLQLVPNLT